MKEGLKVGARRLFLTTGASRSKCVRTNTLILLCIQSRISMLSIACISKAMRQKNQSRLVNRYRQLSPRRPKRLVDHGATSKSKRSAASDTRSSSSSFFRGQIEYTEQFRFDLAAGYMLPGCFEDGGGRVARKYDLRLFDCRCKVGGTL